MFDGLPTALLAIGMMFTFVLGLCGIASVVKLRRDRREALRNPLVVAYIFGLGSNMSRPDTANEPTRPGKLDERAIKQIEDAVRKRHRTPPKQQDLN